MPQLLKDGNVIDNSWQLVDADTDALPQGIFWFQPASGMKQQDYWPIVQALSVCGLTAMKRLKPLPMGL